MDQLLGKELIGNLYYSTTTTMLFFFKGATRQRGRNGAWRLLPNPLSSALVVLKWCWWVSVGQPSQECFEFMVILGPVSAVMRTSSSGWLVTTVTPLCYEKLYQPSSQLGMGRKILRRLGKNKKNLGVI